MKNFIDREQELNTLQNEYQREGSSFVVLYGRRRVGKTTLISEFIEDKPALFFLATEESEHQNRESFRQKAADLIDNDLLRASSGLSWEMIFKAISGTTFSEKPVIVIDEFQYIGKSNPAFPSVFQKIWDEILQKTSVMVILCGSLISMMESQTLSYSSPLYGRRTAQIRLKQIPFRYYREFYPEQKRLDLIKFYAVTGGVPKYIELFSDTKSLFSAIEKYILNTGGFLYEEPQFLLRQEVEDIGSYFSIIRSIAAGNSKLSAIAGMLGVKATGLTKYLKTLIDLDIIEREVPVTEEHPEKSKRGLYKIKDNYLRFWFSFVYPNRSYIESGHPKLVMDQIKDAFVPRQVSFVYEDICRERMWELSAAGTWPFALSKVGRYWDKQQEIDVIGLDEQQHNIIFGECKFWKSAVGINILQALKEKAKTVPWHKNERSEWYILFSANGFTEELKMLAKKETNLVLISEIE